VRDGSLTGDVPTDDPPI